MNIHEHQAKQILKKYGAVVPDGVFSHSVEELVEKAKSLKTEKLVLKAQIHAGGRGKAGGIKIVNTIEELSSAAKEILGKNLITHQTGPQGREVKRLYVETSSKIDKEFYLSCLVDRASSKIAFISSDQGGMDIEEVAEKTPEKILKIFVDPGIGLRPYQASELAFGLKIDEINPKLIRPAVAVFMSLYETFMQEDCSLLEINPLVLTGDGRVIALDAKLSFDDNAMYRHKDNLALRDKDEEDPLEVEASEADLNYIKLDGSIGCMVNGAGLAMGTMDIIKSYGGDPANFLDVGGAANQENVEKAFRLITKDPNVKCILINIFGGIVRCDMVAAGVIAAFKNVNLQIPVVVRLEGTNSEEAHQLVNESGLTDSLLMADGIRDAAEKAVAAAS